MTKTASLLQAMILVAACGADQQNNNSDSNILDKDSGVDALGGDHSALDAPRTPPDSSIDSTHDAIRDTGEDTPITDKPGSSCAEAIDVTSYLDNGSIKGSLQDIATTAWCAGTITRGVYLKFKAPAAGNYGVESADPGGSVIIRSDCADPQSELHCDATPLHVRFGLQTAGWAYVLYANPDTAATQFELTLTTHDACNSSSWCSNWASTDSRCDPSSGICWTPSQYCAQGSADCGDAFTSECATDLLTNVDHCGECGQACGIDNTTSVECSNGTCSLSCAAGFDDCNDDPTDGCEKETLTDGLNCGACGQSCGGGPCVGGQCGDPPQPIATKQAATRLAIDDDYLYWKNGYSSDKAVEKSIVRLSKTGSGEAVQVVVSGISSFYGFVIDSTHVYFGTIDGVKKAPKSGGTATLLASDSYAFNVGLDSSHVYWTTNSDEIKRMVKTGGTATTLAPSNAAIEALLIDDQYLYWVETSSLWRASKTDGSAPTQLATANNSATIPESGDRRRVVASGSHLYFAETQQGNTDQIYKVASTGGPKALVAAASGNAYDLAISGGHLLWRTCSTIDKVSLAGGPIQTVAYLSGGCTTGDRMVVDKSKVYFNRADKVFSIAH